MKHQHPQGGWVKLHRALQNWSHVDEDGMLAVWVLLLMWAEPAPIKREGVRLYPGQILTDYDEISRTFDEDRWWVRYRIQKLIESREIKMKRLGNWLIITICKWADFQGDRNSKKEKNEEVSHLDSHSVSHLDSHSVSHLDSHSLSHFDASQINEKEAVTAAQEKILSHLDSHLDSHSLSHVCPYFSSHLVSPLFNNIGEEENKNIKNNKKLEVVVAGRAWAREEFLNFYFSDNRIKDLKAYCESENLTPEQYRAIAEQCVSEWFLKNETVEYESTDKALEHLFNHVRVKIEKKKTGAPRGSANKNGRQAPTNQHRDTESNETRKSIDPDSREAYSAVIAAKLAGEFTEPEVDGLY